MRLVVSLTRKPSEAEPIFRDIIAVSLSWPGDDGMSYFLARPEDYDSPEAMWGSVARALEKSDVVPYGWNIHRDIWPCICLNMAKNGVKFQKFHSLTEKWPKTMLGEIAYIATQGAYREVPAARDVYKFMFGEDVKALDENERALSVGQQELNDNCHHEHLCYHKMLEAYK